MKATFGAGCFWCIENDFRKNGVMSTSVGYMGGHLKNPTYEDVCTDTTGHAEVIQVEYDSSKISYGTLLDIFWRNHDPTTLNRQGPDIGKQYRSTIFFHTLEQEREAQQSKDDLEKSGKYGKKIVTEIVPATEFYKAEDYHQQYYEKCGLV
ncbi:peptide-methionine (S)-S-oxide reductase MsrA [Candidatus Nitrosotalea bavarica]|uniref:peptide-methionine (S)-S-oxide reductase MsrA n=1 Tax=Candidatus Nitrosotalea bavarica TaxID=1903277 RepID=UPI000C7120BA|nr:peptide-methionine (S)-S-oxide reductase MsrA [Candidatus Nitrosotalea bavarica]